MNKARARVNETTPTVNGAAPPVNARSPESDTPPILATAPIPLHRIRPCRTNPRRAFDKDSLIELADSIRSHGILQPLLLRRYPPGSSAEPPEYEIVAGERRWRAAKLAGLTAIPALVRELTDPEVLEIQVIENLQRTDLHPLEEAEGYRQLHEKHGYSIEDLAAKVGKSKAYVYARLKLGSLPKAAKELFLQGELSSSVALLVARIPDAVQAEKFAWECGTPRHGGEPRSYRQAFDLYQRDYMLRLAEAPFPTADAQLVAAAGSCTSCPKRTGNQPELFGDIKSADVCTDTVCYGRKRDAWEKLQVADLTAAGARLAGPQERRKVYPQDWSSSPSRGYVDLDGRCEPLGYDQDKTWRQLLKKQIPPAQVLLVREPRAGALRHVMTERDAREALKAAGVRIPRPATGGSDAEWRKQRQKQRQKVALNQVLHDQALQRLREPARKARITVPLLRLVARALNIHNDVSDKAIATADERELAAILATGVVTQDRSLLAEVCALYRIDVKKLEQEIKADTRKCRKCGCTTLKACPGGCSWVEDDLCSRCQKKSPARKRRAKAA